MIKTESAVVNRICQGDIFRDIEYIEYALEKSGTFEISKIIFPFVVVLTQDCDLEQDFNNRTDVEKQNQDKHLISVIVAPLYNVEHVYVGEHLSELGLTMQQIPKDKMHAGKFLRDNQLPRYHYLEFDSQIPIPASVIDFKHYFTVNLEMLLKVKSSNHVCKISPLYRESISLRFANFLSRIGLPTT